jgi:hypothetical protein
MQNRAIGPMIAVTGVGELADRRGLRRANSAKPLDGPSCNRKVKALTGLRRARETLGLKAGTGEVLLRDRCGGPSRLPSEASSRGGKRIHPEGLRGTASMDNFTPLPTLIGGALIGLSAAILRQIAGANVAIKGFGKLARLSSRAEVSDAGSSHDDLHQGARTGVQIRHYGLSDINPARSASGEWFFRWSTSHPFPPRSAGP